MFTKQYVFVNNFLSKRLSRGAVLAAVSFELAMQRQLPMN